MMTANMFAGKTIEDPAAIEVARKAIKEYYDKQNARTKSKL